MKILQKKVLFLTFEEKNHPAQDFFMPKFRGKATVGLKLFLFPPRFFPGKYFARRKKNSRPKYFPGNFLAGTKFSTPGGVICSLPQKEIFSEKIFPEKIHSKNMKSQFEQKKRHFFILFSQRLRFGLWIFFFAEFQTLSSSF